MQIALFLSLILLLEILMVLRFREKYGTKAEREELRKKLREDLRFLQNNPFTSARKQPEHTLDSARMTDQETTETR